MQMPVATAVPVGYARSKKREAAENGIVTVDAIIGTKWGKDDKI